MVWWSDGVERIWKTRSSRPARKTGSKSSRRREGADSLEGLTSRSRDHDDWPKRKEAKRVVILVTIVLWLRPGARTAPATHHTNMYLGQSISLCPFPAASGCASVAGRMYLPKLLSCRSTSSARWTLQVGCHMQCRLQVSCSNKHSRAHARRVNYRLLAPSKSLQLLCPSAAGCERTEFGLDEISLPSVRCNSQLRILTPS